MKKRTLMILLTVIMIMSVMCISASANGEQITSSYELKDGILTVNRMADWDNPADRPWADQLDQIRKVVIADGVAKVGVNAFNGCVNLTEVIMPDSLETLGDWCMSNCKKLTEIDLPEGVTAINRYAFQNCSGVKTIRLPSTLDRIAAYAFEGCTGVTKLEIPSLNSWLNCHFLPPAYAASPLASARVNAVDIYIGGTCVRDMDALVIPFEVWDLHPGTFAGWQGLSRIELSEGIRTIGEGVFRGCLGVDSISFPSTLQKIGDTAFMLCNVASRVEIPSLDQWMNLDIDYNNAIFYGSQAGLYADGELVTSLHIPADSGMTAIKPNLFCDYKHLKEVVIEAPVTTLGSCCFRGTGIQTITLPATLTDMSDSIGYCYDLNTINFEGTLEQWEAVEKYYSTNETIQRAQVIAVQNQGSGEGYSWKLLSNGKLVIEGTGRMPDFATAEDQPWAAFRTQIRTLEVREGVTGLGKNAFNGCTALTEMTLPASLEELGAYCLSGCSNVTELTIPANVKKVQNCAFEGMTGVTRINLGSLENWYKAELVSPHMPVADLYINGEIVTRVNLPENMTKVGDYLFQGFRITTFSVPNGITEIGKESFADNPELHITLPKSIQIIGEGAFRNTRLEAIMIPEGVETVGAYAFAGSNLKRVQIPVSVKSIGECAFENTQLNYVYYPGVQAQWDAMNIGAGNELLLNAPRTMYLGAGMFGAAGTEDPSVKWYVENTGLMVISGSGKMGYIASPEDAPWKALIDQGLIREVRILDGVTSLPRYAFDSCTSLTEIALPNSMEEICSRSLYQCTGVQELTIPANIKRVEQFAFSNMTGLTKINLASLKSWCEADVSTPGFSNVDLYVENQLVTDLVLPEGITAVGPSLFENLKLQSVTIPKGVTTIGSKAFLRNSSLRTVNLPEGLKTIGDYAFGYSGLEALDLPSTVETLKLGAFAGNHLKQVHIPLSLKTVENAAFQNNAIEHVYYDGTQEQWNAINIDPQNNEPLLNAPRTLIMASGMFGKNGASDPAIRWTLDTDGLMVFTGTGDMGYGWIDGDDIPWKKFADSGSIKKVHIGEGITSLSDYAFSGCRSLTEITFPSTMKTLGDSCMSTCVNVKNVTIPASVSKIEMRAFENMLSLEYLNIEDLESWCNCDINFPVFPKTELRVAGEKVTDLVLPDGLTKVGAYQFDSLKIQSVTIPEGVTEIGRAAFSDNPELTSVSLPEGLKTIDAYAFMGNNLTHVDFPDTLETVNRDAFSSLRLAYVYLPQTLRTVGENAFISGLQHIFYQGTQEQWEALDIRKSGMENVEIHFGASRDLVTAEERFGGTAYICSICEHPIAYDSRITDMEIVTKPDKLEYKEGEALDLTGGTMKLTRDDGETKIEPMELYMANQTKAEYAGNNQIVLRYFDKAIYFNVVAEHIPGEAVRENEVAATCSKAGSYDEVVYCDVCGKEISRTHKTIEKLPHTPGEAVRENEVAATCSKTGSYDEVVYCDVCGEEVSRTHKTIEKLPHTPGEPVRENEVAATCSKTGSYDEVVYCTVCHEEVSRTQKTINKLPHTTAAPVKENEVAATCTEDGSYDMVKYCSVCGEELERIHTVVPKLGHNPGEATKENEVAPTCTEDGGYDMVVRCTRCGEELSREHTVVPKLGHNPGEAAKENEVAPTCTEDGGYDMVVRCTRCGEELSREHTVVPKLGHNPGKTMKENEVAPTCTAPGGYDMVIRCTVCGEELSRVHTTIPKLSHTRGQAVKENEVAPTCTEAGGYDMVTRCTVCGEELSRVHTVLPKLGHKTGQAVKENEVAATCAEAGGYDSVIYCTVCGEELHREHIVLPKLNHTPGETVRENEVESTCAKAGSYDEVVYCTVCHQEISRKTVNLEKLPHTPADAVREDEIPATCQRPGSYDMVVYCSECHAELSRETFEIPKIDHKPADAVKENEIPAGIGKEGSYDLVVYCSVCHEELSRETVIIPALDVDLPFTDVSPNASYYNPVAWAVENGITSGMTNTTFEPMRGCTRAQVVTFLWRAKGCPEPQTTENPFTDVPENRFYYKAVLWAVENGITNGMTETTFGPELTCTRGHVVTFLWRAMGKPAVTGGESPFTDVTDGRFYCTPIQWAVENGITNGITDTTFRPESTCTRGQIVTFLYRAFA